MEMSELREDPEDGNLYTRADFDAFYKKKAGERWANAEKRIDPRDGKEKRKEDFDKFDWMTSWNKAEYTTASASEEERKLDKLDKNKPKTKAQFAEFYTADFWQTAAPFVQKKPKPCYCGQELEQMTIQCDKCQRWIHLSCAKLSEKQAVLLESFVCSKCKSSKKRKKGESSEPIGPTLNEIAYHAAKSSIDNGRNLWRAMMVTENILKENGVVGPLIKGMAHEIAWQAWNDTSVL